MTVVFKLRVRVAYVANLELISSPTCVLPRVICDLRPATVNPHYLLIAHRRQTDAKRTRHTTESSVSPFNENSNSDKFTA